MAHQAGVDTEMDNFVEGIGTSKEEKVDMLVFVLVLGAGASRFCPSCITMEFLLIVFGGFIQALASK